MTHPGPSILATRLSSIMMNRVQSNSVLLLMCLLTGIIAYLALIAAAWLALEQSTNAIFASLILAALMMVLTLIIWAIKRFRDKRERARQTLAQHQLLSTLTHSTIDRALAKNQLMAPAIALIGWSLFTKEKDAEAELKRRLSR